MHQSHSFSLLRFLYKNGGKKHPFCSFALIHLMAYTEPKISVFVRSYCSGFVKLIIEYRSVFKNIRFCAFTLIPSVFKSLRVCGYPLLMAFSKTSVCVPLCADRCEYLHKDGAFSLRVRTKMEQCEDFLTRSESYHVYHVYTYSSSDFVDQSLL